MDDLQVVNKALTSLDVAQIGSLSEESEPARVMSALLPTVKRIVLKEFKWSFLSDIIDLVESTITPPDPYRYSWMYPDGIVTIFAVYTKYRKPVDYRTLLHSGIKIIVTNVDSAIVEVVRSITDQSTWEDDVQDALVTRLAHEGCPRLTGNFPLASQLLEKYGTLIRNASLHSVVEENARSNRKAYKSYIHVRY